MVTPQPQTSLVDSIDARQNEVLEELDRLNGRIEHLLEQWTRGRAEVPAQRGERLAS